MSRVHTPTPEQLAKAEARRLKKEQAKKITAEAPKTPVDDSRARILPREWLELHQPGNGGLSLRVMTWNLLAQTLVRRELFPTSDCLKAAQREHMIYNEILSHRAAICCLQEVDRTEKLFPELERAGYACKHGCLIAYRAAAFECVRRRVVAYDEQEVRAADRVLDEGSTRKGSSFRTKNIANVVALQRRDAPDEGVIVATTHLFWHPRTHKLHPPPEVAKFRAEGGDAQSRWPCIIAGDFNFGPDDAAYSLLVGDPLLPAQKAMLERSRVVHASIDPSVPQTGKPEEEDPDPDPDRVIVNARRARPPTGCSPTRSSSASSARPSTGAPPTSAYDAGMRTVPSLADRQLTFGSRATVDGARRGANEPVYTSYTHYWQAVLDYIFVLDAPGRGVTVEGLAAPHPAEAFGEGLPRKGVCGSDHISLAADLHWPSA
ncbi:Endonuclease/exonuclease/phosphatase [Epithele typhae]|uniref:Endonuclease/exonuclease/phosphatase n=1 Tax=Epithele typhae TaxID=378194 RepID=UPI002007F52F|nr:Endonuclease/exonuclease/phosphatase [Epithele typhae]KAH9944043.1 Endonuclease/exonuclease/phosphatase [Epithele typhae]